MPSRTSPKRTSQTRRATDTAPRTNATAAVRRQLEAEIHEGTLVPGDALDEARLAKRFEVSRTPVREALLQLSAQGLVRIVPRSGIYVARLSIPELLAMFELLAELESVCAKLAARRMSEAEVARLKDAHEQAARCLEALDANAYARANAEFHSVLYDGSHNPFLRRQIVSIRRRTQVYRQNLFSRTARIAVSHADHGKVVDAIVRGDAESAAHHMLEHISIGGKDFAEFVSTLQPDFLEPAPPAAQDDDELIVAAGD
jgi:DNA-binding GntR family transcriptional regulator